MSCIGLLSIIYDKPINNKTSKNVKLKKYDFKSATLAAKRDCQQDFQSKRVFDHCFKFIAPCPEMCWTRLD